MYNYLNYVAFSNITLHCITFCYIALNYNTLITLKTKQGKNTCRHTVPTTKLYATRNHRNSDDNFTFKRRWTSFLILLKLCFISCFANVHMCAKKYGFGKPFWSYSQTAKFQTLTLKIKIKDTYDMAEVQLPNVLCRPAMYTKNDVYKFY